MIADNAVELPRPRSQLTSREDPRFIAIRHRTFETISKEMAEE
jgi:hypothetical protein